MKKTISLLLSFIMLISSLFSLNVTAYADYQSYDWDFESKSVPIIKKYVKETGYTNNKGGKVVKHVVKSNGETLEGYLVVSSDNVLTLQLTAESSSHHAFVTYYAEGILSSSGVKVEIQDFFLKNGSATGYYSTYSNVYPHSHTDSDVPIFPIYEIETTASYDSCQKMARLIWKMAFIVWQEMIPVSMLGFRNYCEEHDYTVTKPDSSTCKYSGSTEFECVNCGLVQHYSTSAKGHSPTKIEGKSATCTEDGLTEGEKCTVCGEILKSQKTIKATGHSFNGGANCTVCGANNPKYVPSTSNSSTVTSTNNNANKNTSKTPKATSIKKITSGKKQIKIIWNAVSGVTQYNIQYSNDKKFKKGAKNVYIKGGKKTSASVKKLKSNKTYYVRIRTYNNGKYSSWSKVKSIKVK